MIRTIKNFIISISFIYVGIVTGFILDEWQKNSEVINYATKELSSASRISREYEYMDRMWKIMRDAGILYGYINKPGSSICELDLKAGCGSCVSG